MRTHFARVNETQTRAFAMGANMPL